MDLLDSFLDDYFAECDEHLSGARRTLLALEGALGDPNTERGAIEELFRIYHSLKGISGMVELYAAEQLAHELESYLRAVRQHDAALTAEGVDALIEGTQRLEHVIAARKHSASIPAIDDVVQRVGRLVQGSEGGRAVPSAPSPSPGQADQWRVIFRPSKELMGRGIGVDTIRRRLSDIGEIASATPRVTGEGAIEFEFVVTSTAPASTLEGLRDVGAEFERIQADVRPSIPERTVDRDTKDGAIVGPSHFVRVDLTRLDHLMRSVGDLVISRARLADSLARVERYCPGLEWRAVQENTASIDRQLRMLREGIMRVRLVPVGEIFRRMPFVVRDLARSMHKQIELRLVGQTTEIDKYLIERMMDPVLHLVRNAISHGIETPDERVAAGKPPDGTITLSAATSGDTVTIEIADDGRGIDVAGVAARARAAGIPVPAGELPPAAVLSILCAPGFSTRDQSDRAAGRGVGMAVVKTTVEELSGTIELHTRYGAGTHFGISLPLTLAITDALIARVGDQTFAVPQGAIQEVLEIADRDVRLLEQNEVAPHRDAALPIVRLDRLFGIERRARDRFHVFVLGTGPAAFGLAVDRIVGQREIVVRPISDPLVRVDGISGATDLGDGHVVLILDPAALSRAAIERAGLAVSTLSPTIGRTAAGAV